MELLKNMFTRNTWLFFHILGGGIIAKICQDWFGLYDQTTFTVVLLIAIAWEFVEYFSQSPERIKEIYGSFSRYFQDALGDVFGALMITLIIIW